MNGTAARLRPLPADGAEVIRLRTRSGAPIRGHALLIGSPVAGLQGVPECLELVRSWLQSRGFVVAGSGVRSEAAAVEQHMHALIADVEPGDWVLVYYAGHGMQVLPGTDGEPRPLAVLLPIDAFDSQVVIAGDTWLGWLRELSSKAAPAGDEGPGVALVLECCHALALMERWPTAEAREALMERIRRRMATHRLRDATDPLPGVVRVLATGRDDRADVGEMTSALVGRLRAHPDEPWWALMDRLRSSWTKAQQHPGVTGAIDRIPLSAERFARPAGLVPCVRRDGRWTIEHARAMGWSSHRRLALTPSLQLPARAWARLSADGAQLQWLEPTAPWPEPTDGFAWAWPAPQGRRAVVVVDGDDPRRRRELADRLEPLVHQVYEQTPLGRLPEGHGLIRFEAQGTSVAIFDRWGDLVARTARHEPDVWSAWLDRLLSLDDWLGLAGEASPWPDDSIRLRWGDWGPDAEPHPFPVDPGPLAADARVWVQVDAEPWVRAWVSLFRIRADRSVQMLSAHAPGGLDVVGGRPAEVGSRDDPLRFEPTTGPTYEGLRTEHLVALVCDRPLPLSALARGPVGSPSTGSPTVYRSDAGSPTQLAMLTRCYRLGPARAPRAQSSVGP